MKLLKRHLILKLVNEFLIDSPAPKNINYFWNFGSLLGLIWLIMVISGITLAMHYSSTINTAYLSVEHIMRDVNNGWLIRYIHANGASLFFLFVYLHIGRGLYYNSYKMPRNLLWILGVLIYFLMMATAFLGYVLPWGQMSYWGATVITNFFSAIPWLGNHLVKLIWGGYSVDNATLNRFFSAHYLLPFVLGLLIILHLLSLHEFASNNPLGISSLSSRLRFHPYFTIKDLITVFLMLILLSLLIFYSPYVLGHPDNSIPANSLVTPHSIVPEWYFLPFYAILRAIPHKLGGVIFMMLAILILLFLPLSSLNTRNLSFRPVYKFLFWVFCANFLFLLWLGAKPIAAPYIFLGLISTTLYFSFFLLS